MAFELAKNRINVLSITYLAKGEYSVIFEYAYYNSDRSKVWAKDFLIVEADRLTGNGMVETINREILKYATELRSKLEG